MIELKYEQPAEGRRIHRLILDGTLLEVDQAYVFGIGGRDVSVAIHGDSATTLIRRQRISEVPPELTRLTIDPGSVQSAPDLRLRTAFRRDAVGSPLQLGFVFTFRVALWKRPYSMGEVRAAVLRRVGSGSVPGVEANTQRLNASMPSFTIDVSLYDREATIAEVVDRWDPELTKVLGDVELELGSKTRTDSMVALFDFPPDVRVPCEQYLLFFAEFLKDVGVDAQTDITHDAGRVLFSVTPKDGPNALGRIREALECYLDLPSAPLDIQTLESDPRVQQLVANIQHLRGQLVLANATIQYKDATIGHLAAPRGGTRQLLSGEVLHDSLRVVASSDRPSDEEEIIPGVVSVSQYKAKGVSINLAELYRRFRLRFLSSGESDKDT